MGVPCDEKSMYDLKLSDFIPESLINRNNLLIYIYCNMFLPRALCVAVRCMPGDIILSNLIRIYDNLRFEISSRVRI